MISKIFENLNKFNLKSQNDDFHKQDISFDINKLQEACNEILAMKGFDTSLGIPHFASISLNQIPGDKKSIEGHNVRGTYWTLPDETGKEDTPLFREVQILNTVDEKERLDKVRAYEEKHGVEIL